MMQFAECPIGLGAESHGAAHPHAEQAHSEAAHDGLERIGPAGDRCHHDTGHQHMDSAEKLYASPRRVVDQVSTPVGFDTSAAGALVVLGVR